MDKMINNCVIDLGWPIIFDFLCYFFEKINLLKYFCFEMSTSFQSIGGAHK